jgi:hypothetical protein
MLAPVRFNFPKAAASELRPTAEVSNSWNSSAAGTDHGSPGLLGPALVSLVVGPTSQVATVGTKSVDASEAEKDERCDVRMNFGVELSQVDGIGEIKVLKP